MSNEAKVLIGVSIATIVIVIGAALMFGGQPQNKEESTTEPIANQEVLIRDDSHVIKAENEKVVIVEFGDFQCPACGASHPIVEQLLAEFGDQVTFVFRNFPLAMHQNAEAAHLAAEAAGEQDKFFEMHDLLFENQSDWENVKDPKETFIGYAKELKLDEEQFTKALDEKKYADKIKKDSDDGYAAGVNSTPTFFINGVKQSGGLPYNEFKAKIEGLLNESETAK